MAHRDPDITIVVPVFRNASTDESLDILNSLARNAGVVVVPMPSNIGQHRAVLEGLRHACGQTGGFAAVYAARRGQFQSCFRRLTSRAFKASMRALAGVPVDMGPFGALDRRVVERLLADTTPRPFLPAMIVGAGLPIGSVPVVRSSRAAGRSAYTNWARLVMGLTAIAGIFWSRRLRIFRSRGTRLDV